MCMPLIIFSINGSSRRSCAILARRRHMFSMESVMSVARIPSLPSSSRALHAVYLKVEGFHIGRVTGLPLRVDCSAAHPISAVGAEFSKLRKDCSPVFIQLMKCSTQAPVWCLTTSPLSGVVVFSGQQFSGVVRVGSRG